jgi:hypothetical protein
MHHSIYMYAIYTCAAWVYHLEHQDAEHYPEANASVENEALLWVSLLIGPNRLILFVRDLHIEGSCNVLTPTQSQWR